MLRKFHALSNMVALCGTTLLMLPNAQAAAVSIRPLTSQEKAIESAGVGIAILLPVTAAGISIYKDDFAGLGQLAVESIATVGTAYAIKNLVHEQRPDGSDYHSFPSDTTALAASGSSFLWGRYGWQYGLPALAATEFVSFSRVQAKQHHWYDTLASSALSAGYAAIFTTRFYRYRIYSDLDAAPDGAALHVRYDF